MEEKTKKGAFTKQENKKPPVQVKKIEEAEVVEVKPEEQFPQSRSMVPIKEFDAPLVKVEEAVAAFKTYQKLINALIDNKDIVVIKRGGKETKISKKSGINKIAKFFGYNCEIVRAYKEDFLGPQGGKHFVWRVWAKAIAPNGRFRVSGAACATNERMFAHREHDVYATAETRAKKRAIEELAGMGEIELEEDNGSQPPEDLPNSSREPQASEIPEYPKKEIKPGMTAVVKEEKSILKPMYKSPVCSIVNFEIEASEEQKKMIADLLTKEGIDLAAEKLPVFMLGRKPNTREVQLQKMTKLDAWDLICVIRKGDLAKVIVK